MNLRKSGPVALFFMVLLVLAADELAAQYCSPDDIELSSQAEVDAVRAVHALSILTTVGGRVSIAGRLLVSLAGLENLTSI